MYKSQVIFAGCTPRGSMRRLLVQMHARTQRCYRCRSGCVKCWAFTRGARLRLRGLLRGVRSRATVKPRCALSYLPNVFAQERREVEAALVRKQRSFAIFMMLSARSQNGPRPMFFFFFIYVLCRPTSPVYRWFCTISITVISEKSSLAFRIWCRIAMSSATSPYVL